MGALMLLLMEAPGEFLLEAALELLAVAPRSLLRNLLGNT